MSNALAPSNAPRRLGRPPRGSEHEIAIRVLDAATPIFFRDGYEGTSVDAVVLAAGISKKTFYTRFSGKDDLFEAVCVRYIEREMRFIEGTADNATGPTRDRLYRIAHALLEVALTPDTVSLRRIVIAEALRFPHFARIMHDFGAPKVAVLVERCLSDGVKKGELVVDDIQFSASFFLDATVCSPMDRATSGVEKPGLNHTKREMLRRSVDLFMKTCEVRTSKGPPD